MKKLVFLLALLFIISCANQPKSIVLNLEYDNGDVLLKDKELIYSDSEKKYFGEYTAFILDKEYKVLSSIILDIPINAEIEWFDETGKVITREMTEIKKIDFKLIIPYNKNAQKLYIFKEDPTNMLWLVKIT